MRQPPPRALLHHTTTIRSRSFTVSGNPVGIIHVQNNNIIYEFPRRVAYIIISQQYPGIIPLSRGDQRVHVQGLILILLLHLAAVRFTSRAAGDVSSTGGGEIYLKVMRVVVVIVIVIVIVIGVDVLYRVLYAFII